LVVRKGNGSSAKWPSLAAQGQSRKLTVAPAVTAGLSLSIRVYYGGIDVTTRRQFLAGASAIAAGASLKIDLLAADRPPLQPPPTWFLNRLPRLMEISGTPGVAAVVIQRGRVVWEHYDGVLTAGEPAQVNRETMWPAASLGKPVFAAAALSLVPDSRLDLNRPLREYVADHAAADARTAKVTARHVLSHTSGFPNWRNRPDQPLVSQFEPGSRFSYSGEGYYYLQRAVEHITGMGVQQFVSRTVFEPLGLKSATYAWRADVPSRLVAGHDRGTARPYGHDDLRAALFSYAASRGRSFDSFTAEDVLDAMKTIPDAPVPTPSVMMPNVAGGLLITPIDYASFLVALLDQTGAALHLASRVRDAMTTSQVVLNSALGWGLGWGLETASGSLWHWGDNGGWKNFVLVEPREMAALLVFTNSSHGMNVAERIVAAATGQDHVAFQWL
jgi:CubicO group peptidase (beta-lactamase class C family)